MKIEKISENQIRCTLSKEDLIDRELRISELAYGTEKAKALFRDMMQQASYEFGFEADDIPLMIEAIPVSTECLILVITKVSDPDELDTRFSSFSPDSDIEEEDSDDEEDSYADEILNCFDQLNDILDNTESEDSDAIISMQEETPGTKKTLTSKDNIDDTKLAANNTNLTKVFTFQNLDEVIQLANQLICMYHGDNSLYKNPVNSTYYLVISKSDHTPEEFNKVCNIISEYGKTEKSTYASTAYYKEHFECIVKDTAIQILCVM